jgi:eukaryotic-like serine/threonine-protein kinase
MTGPTPILWSPMSLTFPDPLFIAFQQALAGRYSIDRELGRGGMGIVFLAHEVHLDRLVAIKLLPPERGRQPDVRNRFLREARVAAKLSHPNIIPIHSVEEAGGFVFYVMAFVDGDTLSSRVRARGPLTASEGARVLREVAWALAYAHDQGLVHRDVKPENILIESATQRVLVADFGIAASVGDVTDGVSGTPEFMSPEQALGKPLDARSDLYSLGATAFFAFSGRFPFEGTTATEVLAKQVTEAAPSLASLGLTVPRKLALLVDRCLAKDPAQRPATAQSLAEHIGLALEQRRDLPAALRAFVKRYGRLNGGGTVLGYLALLPAAFVISYEFGIVAGFTTFTLGLTAAPLAYFTWAARRLTKLGFAHRDVGPAFAAELEQAREELSVERRRGASRLENLARLGAKVFGVVGGVGLAGTLLSAILPIPRAAYLLIMEGVPIAAMMLGLSMLSTLIFLALRQRHQDVETEFWSKMWRSRIGKLAFALSRRLVPAGARGVAMTHRATELSLGMAAEELYESLPRETQKALGDLPTLLRRLQEDAQALRKRHDEMQDALSSIGPAETSPEYAELCALRDETHARLSEAVGSLETIRLNLLRLHAGSASVESVTTHLGLAAEVSEQVERLIQAHADVERYVSFPRKPTPTPV